MVNSEQGLGCLRISTIIAIKPKRRNQGQQLKHNKNAAVGIGTLIVFIAMVLVAAVAASVLIRTSQTLEERAHKVGTETIYEVSSGIEIGDITGYTNENKTYIEYVAIIASPRSGSQYLDIQNIVINVKHNNLSVLCFNENLVAGSVGEGGVFHTLNNSLLNSTDYGVIVLHDADDSVVKNLVLNVGDTIFFVINVSSATNGLEPRETMSGAIIPEFGVEAIFDVRVPPIFIDRIVELY
jgi:flagellin FlaB